MGELTVVSAKIPEEVYNELVLRVPDGERSNFIREAIVKKLREIPRPNKILELEKTISRLEADISKIKKSLADLELLTYGKDKVNPHSFCIDDVDHKILDHLLHYKGATTSELADLLGTNRWLILNRLRKIKTRSKKQLGEPIVEYYPGKKSGKMKAWWINEELVET
jgi:DNA-binding protein Fis